MGFIITIKFNQELRVPGHEPFFKQDLHLDKNDPRAIRKDRAGKITGETSGLGSAYVQGLAILPADLLDL